MLESATERFEVLRQEYDELVDLKVDYLKRKNDNLRGMETLLKYKLIELESVSAELDKEIVDYFKKNPSAAIEITEL